MLEEFENGCFFFQLGPLCTRICCENWAFWKHFSAREIWKCHVYILDEWKKNFKTELFEIYNVAIVVILLRSSFIQTQMQNGFCFVKFLWHPVDKIFDALWFSNFVTRCKWDLNIQGLCSSIHEESVAVCEKHCFYFWQGGKKVVGVKAPWVTAASLGLCFLCGTIDLWLYITQDKLGEGTYRKSLFEGCPSFKQWFRICIILTLE